MPFFPKAWKTQILGSTMIDVQGDFHNAGGNLSIQRFDPLYQILFLEVVKGAAFNSRERDPPPRCQPGTRKIILAEIISWIASKSAMSMSGPCGSAMWLHGPAGAGKSAIAQTICEYGARNGHLAASFFFSRGETVRGKMDNFVTTIAFQLGTTCGSGTLRNLIARAVKRNPLIVHEAMSTQMEQLIIKPLRTMFWGRNRQIKNTLPFLIVVDGLDECRDNSRQSQLLNALLDLVRVHFLPLYILIVSRPEPHIKHAFDTANFGWGKCCIMSLYDDHQARQDVVSFLRQGFKNIRNSERHSAITNTIQDPWPSESVITRIADKSGGYFIYPSTILKFIDEEYHSPTERLKQISSESLTSNNLAFAELDKLYIQVLSTCPKPDLLRKILGCLLITPPNDLHIEQRSDDSIELQLGLRPGEVKLALRGLHSLISFTTPSDSHSTHIDLAHTSLKDFLLDKERAGTFFIDDQEHYKDIAITCWRYFSNSLDTMDPEDIKFIISRGRRPPAGIYASAIAFLMHSFQAHYHVVSDKTRIIDVLKDDNMFNWSTLVHASNDWSFREKVLLSKTVDYVTAELKALTPRLDDLADKSIRLAETIYLGHLSPLSLDDIRLIQGILTMNIMEHETRGYEKFLEVPRSSRSAFVMIYLCWEWRGQPPVGKQSSFIQFMTDPNRYGNLLIEPETHHACLALCCMRELTSSKPRLLVENSIGEHLNYARKNLGRHISRAPSGVDQVLAYLRTLDLGSTFSELARAHDKLRILENTSAILTWLQSLPEPPMDIILPWRFFYEMRLVKGEAWPPLIFIYS